MAQGSHPPFPDTTVGGGSGCLDQNLFGGWLPAHLGRSAQRQFCVWGRSWLLARSWGSFPSSFLGQGTACRWHLLSFLALTTPSPQCLLLQQELGCVSHWVSFLLAIPVQPGCSVWTAFP